MAAFLLSAFGGASGCSSNGTQVGSSATGGGSSAAGGGGSDAGSTPTLGLNDITMLAPLPTSDEPVLFRASDLAADGKPLLPQSLIDQALTIPGSPSALDGLPGDIQLVAVRFDLCDRATVGPCADTEDARFRLVFQQLLPGQAIDVGFHVFYSVPRGSVSDVISALREMAVIQAEPFTSPLHVSKGITAGGEYVVKLKSLLSSYCSESTAVRVTVMGQVAISAAFRWIFHGIEKQDGVFKDIVIPDVMGPAEELLLLGESSYQFTPSVDTPKGLLLAASQQDFAAAPEGDKIEALSALAMVDNPLMSVPNTVQCVGCHISTVVSSHRASESGIDRAALSSVYTTTFATSIDAGESAEQDTIVRALGWRGTDAAISQRVVNETAQALTEIEARF